jgi:recombinational DNA repair protein (RecF pathway)
MRCANCDKILGGDSFKTAYGDWLCEDCWDDYICSEAGRLEYLIGICNGELYVEEFDAEFLAEVAVSWMTHYNLLDLTAEQLAEIEQKAKELGIL